MAPSSGEGEEDGFTLLAREEENLLAPLVPVDAILCGLTHDYLSPGRLFSNFHTTGCLETLGYRLDSRRKQAHLWGQEPLPDGRWSRRRLVSVVQAKDISP